MNEFNRLERKLIALTDRVSLKMALFSAALMTMLGPILIAPALPAIAKHFESTPHIEVLTGLSMTIPALFVLLLAPVAGTLMDRYGRLKFIYPAMVVWILSGLAGGLSQSIYTLIISRCALGIATAFITTGASALLGDYYMLGAGRREKALGMQGFVMALGGACMTMIAGLVVGLGWRWVFGIYGTGIVIFILCVWKLFEPRAHKYLSQPTHTSSAKVSWRDFLPFVPLYFVGFFMSFVYYLVPVEFPHYIADVLGLSSRLSGVALAVPIISYGLFCFLYSKVVKKIGARNIYLVALGIEALSFGALYLWQDVAVSFCALFVFGMAGGLIMTNNSALLFAKAPAFMRARAYSVLASSMFIGQLISPLITTPLRNALGYETLFLVLTVLIALVCAWSARGFRGV